MRHAPFLHPHHPRRSSIPRVASNPRGRRQPPRRDQPRARGPGCTSGSHCAARPCSPGPGRQAGPLTGCVPGTHPRRTQTDPPELAMPMHAEQPPLAWAAPRRPIRAGAARAEAPRGTGKYGRSDPPPVCLFGPRRWIWTACPADGVARRRSDHLYRPAPAKT